MVGIIQPRNCKTCRHWDDENEEAILWTPGAGLCMAPKSQFPPMEFVEEGPAEYSAATEKHANISITGPRFGCVHWEAKQD